MLGLTSSKYSSAYFYPAVGVKVNGKLIFFFDFFKGYEVEFSYIKVTYLIDKVFGK